MLSTKLVIYLQRVAIDITQELQIISGVFRNLLRGVTRSKCQLYANSTKSTYRFLAWFSQKNLKIEKLKN